ncbi:MAG: hypothetical protein M3N51_00725 [Actinomycetota bacterium]|nr:hypothetical protein [Actinomycetota bacterium]
MHDDQLGTFRQSAALLTGAAGVLHLAVVAEHLAVAPVLGALFALAAGLQLAWAWLMMLRPLARFAGLLSTIGAVGNAGGVSAWALSRTVGLPFGHIPGVPEPIGLLDVTATAFQVAALAGLLATLHPWSATRRPSPVGLPWRLGLFVYLLTTGVLLSPAGPHTHEHVDGHHHTHDMAP